MSKIQVQMQEVPQGLLVRIIGDGGVAEVGELDRQLLAVTAKRPGVVIVDLSQMSFISSLGMGSLVNLHRGISRHGGTVRFAAAQAPVVESFKRARLQDLLRIYPTLAEASAV